MGYLLMMFAASLVGIATSASILWPGFAPLAVCGGTMAGSLFTAAILIFSRASLRG